jgi:hypothetical protein
LTDEQESRPSLPFEFISRVYFSWNSAHPMPPAVSFLIYIVYINNMRVLASGKFVTNISASSVLPSYFCLRVIHHVLIISC